MRAVVDGDEPAGAVVDGVFGEGDESAVAGGGSLGECLVGDEPVEAFPL